MRANQEKFAARKHDLMQAILAVNDLFYIAQSNVANFFLEDVGLWLDNADVRYVERVTLKGHSGYDHRFDFAIPKSKHAPERLLRVINNPNKENAQNVAFAWLDTKNGRPADSLAFAILNDNNLKIGSTVESALLKYDVTPIEWSKRGEFLERLAA
ncbi:MAG: protein of unknown function DUF1829 [Glomeribacter sp. 1016415]|nr:protein of unknown function DUF1829 [Glomeribacter sp. 1016415]